jgi:ribonuclease III family protein
MIENKPDCIKPCLLSPGMLAYIGDSVYEVFVRTRLVKSGFCSLNKIHKEAIKYVNAKAQAKGLKLIESNLSREEGDIVRRGRNSKTGNVPTNTKLMEYKYSTGLEALFGFLYLNGDFERINVLGEKMLKELGWNNDS